MTTNTTKRWCLGLLMVHLFLINSSKLLDLWTLINNIMDTNSDLIKENFSLIVLIVVRITIISDDMFLDFDKREWLFSILSSNWITFIETSHHQFIYFVHLLLVIISISWSLSSTVFYALFSYLSSYVSLSLVSATGSIKTLQQLFGLWKNLYWRKGKGGEKEAW